MSPFQLQFQHRYVWRTVAVILCVIICHWPLTVAGSAEKPSSYPIQPETETITPPRKQLLLQFYADVDESTRWAVIADLGGWESHWLPQINSAVVQISEQRLAAFDVMALPQWHPRLLKYAESDLDIVGTHVQEAPVSQGADKDYGLRAIQAQSAWAVTQGASNMIVAVLDSGINANHPELRDRLVAGYDFVSDDPDPNDGSGHGTHIAGIIGAADDGIGMTGVCPACSLMPVRVLDDQNLGSWSSLVRGILYAVDHDASVINLSLGTTGHSQTLQAAIDYALQHDVLIVAAAGNAQSPTLFFPAALEGVLAVGAIGPDDQRWDSSNIGSFVDIVAPGQLIYSTYHDVNNRFHGYTYMSGTSMATPYVSGLLALLKSAYPDRPAGELIQLLIDGVDDLGEPGWDTNYGYGRINAAQTMHLPIASATSSGQHDIKAGQVNQLYMPFITGN